MVGLKLDILIRALTVSVLEKFRVTHGLEKKKKGIFKRIFGYAGVFICLMFPVVQVFMIMMMLVLIVAYSQTKDKELIDTLKSKW